MDGFAFFGGLTIAGFVVALVVLGFQVSSERSRMIDAGLCAVDAEEWHQPPPTYHKVGQTLIPIQGSPYLREHWTCQNGDGFWRRKRN